MPGQNGGSRPGSGRKPKADKHKGAIARAEKRFADRLPELADKVLELSYGIWREQDMPDGSTTVYKTPPDLKALVYALDRIMGKPKQALEHSGPDAGPIKITVEYEDAIPLDQASEAPPGPGEDPEGDAAV
jgi:hypothetical protein